MISGQRLWNYTSWAVRDLIVSFWLAALAAVLLYIPPQWNADLGPHPDALEYAITARNLADGGSYTISLFGKQYPPRYPFGLPLLLVPTYWLPQAALTSGLYGILVCGVTGVVFVYLLARRIAGMAGALASACTLLLRPLFIDWSHQITAEAPTIALVSIAALLLYAVIDSGNTKRRVALLTALGVVAGFAMLVRLSNIVVVAAIVPALLLDRGIRGQLVRYGLVFALGPLLALGALATYAYATFGNITTTGYHYWVPFWHTSPGKTFALAYALREPGHASPAYALSGAPNLIFYTVYTALFLFSVWSSMLAIVGTAMLARDCRVAVRSVVTFGIALSLLNLGLYGLYYFQDLRFMAPAVPLACIFVGSAVTTGLQLVRQWRQRAAQRRVLMGGGILGLALISIVSGFKPVSQQVYAYAHYIRGGNVPDDATWNSVTAHLYRGVVDPNSVLVTMVALPLLGETGLTRDHVIVPMVRRHYWSSPMLQATATFPERQADLADRAARGQIIYTDSRTVEEAHRQQDANATAWQTLQSYRLRPVAESGSIAIYQLLPK